MTESIVSRNVCFLLWQEGISSDRWYRTLRERLGWETNEIVGLLQGGSVSYSQLQQLAQVFHRREEDLSLEDLLTAEGPDVLRQNLMFLMQDMAHGQKKELAKKLGVGPNTVSRWLGGRHHPPSDKISAIADHFGLPPHTDLASTPLFLSLEPVSALQRRNWLHERVDAISASELIALYPALKRLFK